MAEGEDADIERAATRLWAATLAVFVVLTVAGVQSWNAPLIGAFVVLHVLQNLWRPALLSRFDARGSEEQGATLLSIESQSRRAATLIIAPLLGLAIDYVKTHELGGPFWPIGVLGLATALAFLVTGLRQAHAASVVHRTPATAG